MCGGGSSSSSLLALFPYCPECVYARALTVREPVVVNRSYRSLPVAPSSSVAPLVLDAALPRPTCRPDPTPSAGRPPAPVFHVAPLHLSGPDPRRRRHQHQPV